LANLPAKSIKHSVSIAGHATSVTLEPEFWAVLKDIASEKKISVNVLITQIDAEKDRDNLSSAIRVYVLNRFLAAKTNKI
jgi:predicted DNA-binding ribbon-helix-helix protein